jgi:hypothetical protein
MQLCAMCPIFLKITEAKDGVIARDFLIRHVRKNPNL